MQHNRLLPLIRLLRHNTILKHSSCLQPQAVTACVLCPACVLCLCPHISGLNMLHPPSVSKLVGFPHPTHLLAIVAQLFSFPSPSQPFPHLSHNGDCCSVFPLHLSHSPIQNGEDSLQEHTIFISHSPHGNQPTRLMPWWGAI